MNSKKFGPYTGPLLLSLLFASFASGQRVIPFNMASGDPAGKFSFAGWAVMGKFEGTIEIPETGTDGTLRIKLTGGELTASKSSKLVTTLTPFLAKKKGKSFESVAFSNEMLIARWVDPGVPFKLEPYEFLIPVKKKQYISSYWLVFQIGHECRPYPACVAYAHSRADIFSP